MRLFFIEMIPFSPLFLRKSSCALAVGRPRVCLVFVVFDGHLSGGSVSGGRTVIVLLGAAGELELDPLYPRAGSPRAQAILFWAEIK